eukprot:782392-Prorocentrum_minimum.AAC.1
MMLPYLVWTLLLLERISWDLVVGCLRRDPKDGLVKTRDGLAFQRWTSTPRWCMYVLHPTAMYYGARTRGVSPVGEPSSSSDLCYLPIL